MTTVFDNLKCVMEIDLLSVSDIYLASRKDSFEGAYQLIFRTQAQFNMISNAQQIFVSSISGCTPNTDCFSLIKDFIDLSEANGAVMEFGEETVLRYRLNDFLGLNQEQGYY